MGWGRECLGTGGSSGVGEGVLRQRRKEWGRGVSRHRWKEWGRECPGTGEGVQVGLLSYEDGV